MDIFKWKYFVKTNRLLTQTMPRNESYNIPLKSVLQKIFLQNIPRLNSKESFSPALFMSWSQKRPALHHKLLNSPWIH